jgi:hypothetical protein
MLLFASLDLMPTPAPESQKFCRPCHQQHPTNDPHQAWSLTLLLSQSKITTSVCGRKGLDHRPWPSCKGSWERVFLSEHKKTIQKEPNIWKPDRCSVRCFNVVEEVFVYFDIFYPWDHFSVEAHPPCVKQKNSVKSCPDQDSFLVGTESLQAAFLSTFPSLPT